DAIPASGGGYPPRAPPPSSRSESFRGRPRPTRLPRRRPRKSQMALLRNPDRPRVRRGGNSPPAPLGMRFSWPSWPIRYACRLPKSTGWVARGRSNAGRRCGRGRGEDFAGAFEILGGVDAQRDMVDDGNVDAHSRFERAQLLELLAPFQR